MKQVSILFVLGFAKLCGADTTWVLEKGTLTYHISHPLHQVEGVSHEARGKAVCHEGKCDILIAAPVRSFNSGDSNRDLHMLQVTKGGEFPMVVVRTQLPESEKSSSTVNADLEIQFAGQTVQYKQISFQLTMKGNQIHITGTIPSTITDFKIDPPSLLSIPVKNDIPVRVDLTWRSQ